MAIQGREMHELHTLTGQLLATTEATAVSVKDLHVLAAASATNISLLKASVDQLGVTVRDLDRIIKTGSGNGGNGGGDSLVTQMRLAQREIGDLRRTIEQFHTDVNDLIENVSNELGSVSKSVRELENDSNSSHGGLKIAGVIVFAVGWTVSTAIAIYAAVK